MSVDCGQKIQPLMQLLSSSHQDTESHLFDIAADATQLLDGLLRGTNPPEYRYRCAAGPLHMTVLATTSMQAGFGFSSGDAALLDLRSLVPPLRRWMP